MKRIDWKQYMFGDVEQAEPDGEKKGEHREDRPNLASAKGQRSSGFAGAKESMVDDV